MLQGCSYLNNASQKKQFLKLAVTSGKFGFPLKKNSSTYINKMRPVIHVFFSNLFVEIVVQLFITVLLMCY